MSGSVVDACTSATMFSDWDIEAIIQAAPTDWIRPPKFVTRLVIQTARKTGWFSGASAPAGLTSLSANPLAEAGNATKTGIVKAVKKDTPYFTIPENATLMGATAMTAIVGRIPVDGRVQDPMQFKLLLGPNNLAANGHFLPRDLSGIVVSGIAIGDMNLSCSEGIVQSMTFVFSDGAVRTVSMRSNGTMPGLGGQGQGQQAGLVQTAKLGYLSDRYGNPCIAGEFKTHALEYLSAVVV